MSQNPRRNVLAVGFTPLEFDHVVPFLGRDEFDVDRFPTGAGALELTTRVTIAVLLVRYPLPDLEVADFLDQIRRPESPCRQSPVLLLTHAGMLSEAQSYIGRGANRVVDIESEQREIHRVVGSLLDVAPRKSARFLARLEIKLGGAKDMILCQTENLSGSGMLIKTERRYDVGTQLGFEFTLGEDQWPITGVAEVVRHTQIGRDQVGGIGVRFLSFTGDSQRRFDSFLNRL